jgi:hypothetical protein
MGAGLFAVKSGFILFIKDYKFFTQYTRSVRERDHFIASQDGGFSEGLGTSRRRRVIQGADTSSRPLTGTGARHVTSLPPD